MGDYKTETRWLIVYCEKQEGYVYLEMRDNVGRRRRMVVDSLGREIKSHDSPWLLKLAGPEPKLSSREEISGLIRSAVHPFFEQVGHHPRTLPLFLHTTAVGDSLSYPEILQLLEVSGEFENLLRPVYLSRTEWYPRATIRFPLGILVIGEAKHNLEQAKNNWWFQDVVIRQYGIKLTKAKIHSNITDIMGGGKKHIVVTSAADFPETLSSLKGLRSAAHPRLLVSLNNTTSFEESTFDIASIVPGTALVWHNINSDPPGGVVINKLFNGIVHDLALHDSVPQNVTLFTDPAINQGLRISDAYQAELDRMLEKYTFPEFGNVRDLFGYEVATGERPSAAGIFEYLEKEVNANIETLSQLQSTDVEFRHEGEGLLPISKIRQKISEYDPGFRKTKISVARATKTFVNTVRSHQNRKVDFALQRDIRTFFDGLSNKIASDQVDVSPHTILAAGTRYNVRVRIGCPFLQSLLREEVPSVDLLLPIEGKGHDLEIVLYEQDFSILGNRMRTVHLPSVGASRIVGFPVVTPKEPGTARLRLAVYYRDHMLQSFRFQAEVAEKEYISTEKIMLKFELEFSRTKGFVDLGHHKKRGVSIGVNLDPGGATHTFMVKQKGVARPVKLPEAVLGDQIMKFRENLEKVVLADYKNQTFTEKKNPQEFDSVVRELAKQGHALRRALFTRHDSLKGVLKEIRKMENEVLQFVRYDPNYVFPWSIIYDFKLPDDIAGQPPPPVCRGVKNGKTCGHTGRDRVYCLKGFWGIRNQVEELMSFNTGGKPTLTDKDHAKILVVQGYKDKFTDTLIDRLRGKLGTNKVVILPKGELLLDYLWNKAPSLVVVIGHLETKAIKNEPRGPRVVVDPGVQWLQEHKVIEYIEEEDVLNKPQPLILLLSCKVAAVELKTLNDLFTSLYRAGTAGIVGTETVVFTRLAADFAFDFANELWNNHTYGEVVNMIRSKMLREGNPLGFIFTSLGDVDLKFT